MEQYTLLGNYETLLALFTLNLQAYESTANGIDANIKRTEELLD